MKKKFLVLFCCFALKSFCQEDKEEPGSWTPVLGYTQIISIKDSVTGFKENRLRGIDLKFISPRFELITDDTYWSDERKTNPAKFRKARVCIDMMFACHRRFRSLDRVSEFSLTGDFYYAIFRHKRFSLDGLGGLRLYFVTSPDYGLVNFKKVCYWDYGLAAQLNMGFVSPFIDIHRLGYYTFGAEFTLHPVYRKPKRRYKLHKFL